MGDVDFQTSIHTHIQQRSCVRARAHVHAILASTEEGSSCESRAFSRRLLHCNNWLVLIRIRSTSEVSRTVLFSQLRMFGRSCRYVTRLCFCLKCDGHFSDEFLKKCTHHLNEPFRWTGEQPLSLWLTSFSMVSKTDS